MARAPRPCSEEKITSARAGRPCCRKHRSTHHIRVHPHSPVVPFTGDDMKRAFLIVLTLSFGLVAVVRGEAVADGNQVTFRLDTTNWNDKPIRVNLAGS